MARSSLVEEVARRVRELIARDRLAPGDSLPGEVELSRRWEVSRPVLREAIGRLEAIGLVTVRHGRGMFVADREALVGCAGLLRNAIAIPAAGLDKFVQLRFAIECEAARRAAEVATPADLAHLEALAAQIAQADGYEATISADFKFHLAIVELSRNELMRNVLEVSHELLLALLVHTTDLPRDHERRRREHRAIVEGIRSGDPDRAEAAMRQHRRTSERLLAVASHEQGGQGAGS